MKIKALAQQYWPTVVLFVLLFVAWQLAVSYSGIRAYLLPSPWSVVQAFWEPDIPWTQHIWTTTLEIVGAFFMAAAVGVMLGVAIAWSPLIANALVPFLVFLNTLPKVAIAPLLIVWFGFGPTSTIVLVTASTFFPVLVNGLEGFKSTDQDRIDLLRSMGATPGQIFRGVVLPSALPFIFSGLQIGLVTCLLSTIVGEFVNGREGLGARIMQANNVLDIAEVFAVMIILGAMAAIFDFVLRLIRRRFLFWSPGERRPAR